MMTTNNVPIPDWGTASSGGAGNDIPIPDWGGGKGEAKAEGGHMTDLQLSHQPPGPGWLQRQLRDAPGSALSIADMIGSIPASVIGTAADLGFRLKGAADGETRRTQSMMGSIAYQEAMNQYGSPFSKLLRMAGLGSESSGQSGVDGLMAKATSLLEKGGDWVEQHTKGEVSKEDVVTLTNELMALGGGKGLKAGMTKLAGKTADSLVGGMKLGPDAEVAAMRKQTQESNDALAAKKAAEAQAAEAQRALDAQKKTKLASGKALTFDPITGELSEETAAPGKALPKPTTLESAIDKAAGGRLFDMTAEERIAYKGMQDNPNPIVDEQGKILEPGEFKRIRGRLGGGGAISRQRGAVNFDAGADQPGATPEVHTVESLQALEDNTPLKQILDASAYTLKTLNRLPQNKDSFSKAFIEQELKRGDVTDAERATLQSAMEGTPGDKISAKDLMLGVKKATGDFELKPEKTDDFAEYGMTELGRMTTSARDADEWEDASPEEKAAASKGEVPATTTLYRFPEGMDVGDNNHFGDKQLFGWTRSFQEDGVRHVVEVQSDLAQRAGKELSPEDRFQLQKSQTNLRAQAKVFAEHDSPFYKSPNWPESTKALVDKIGQYNEDIKFVLGDKLSHVINDPSLSGDDAFDAAMKEARTNDAMRQRINGAIVDYQRRIGVLKAEHESKLKDSSTATKVSPLLKNWPKRLVREELADAAGAGEKSVRFATADTVAKVEMWPERGQNPTGWESTGPRGPKADSPTRFSPEHQSIYDRYRRDIEKFLKQEGGKEVTDAKGHKWLEVPVPRRGPKQMYGAVDPKLLARLAAVGLGAWAGVHFSDEHDLESALLGGFGGLVAGNIPVSKAVATFKMLAKADQRIKINELGDAHEKYTRLAAHDVWALQKQIEELAPKEAQRAAITHAIEKGDLSSLTPKEKAAAKIAQDYFDGIGRIASLEGVLHAARENYVTHLWDWSKNKGLFEKWMDNKGGTGGMGTSNRFADVRSVPTIEAGKAAGLTPLTEDISAIMGVYGNSMARSIANSVFTRALKLEKVPGTNMDLIMAADKAPHTYVSINNPNMQGLRVHPDIAPSLKMLYDTSSPGAAMKVMQGISDTSKRVAVSFSLFHAKALTDAMIGGSTNPFKALTKLPGFIAGTDHYLQELRKGSASPLAERAAEGGLKFSLEGEGAGVEDAGVGFYGAMESVQGMLDKTLPGAGLPVKGIVALSKQVDNLMWARLHAGMKLNMFAEKYQQLIDNAAKKPGSTLTNDEAARIAASYTNDLFGGLNWRRVAEDAQSRFGREVGHATLNPGARRVLGILAFAPDWTVSTTRAAVQAFGKPDLLNPTTLAGLHQQYLLRSAVYYLIVGDAINHAMSGHHLWQNKDPTVLDMDPKGERHMQWSKHTMEPVHWLTKPGQQAINKMGMIPRELTAQALGVEYLSAKGRMPPMKSRLQHLAKNFAPISAQQMDEGGASVIAGFAGAPIYGKTAAQKAADKEKRRREKERRKG